MSKTLEDLEDILPKDCDYDQPPLFLHPKEVGKRSYDEDELVACAGRDFHSRAFISRTAFDGQNFTLRTRFSDNHAYESHLQAIGEIMSAIHTRERNMVWVRSKMTELMYMCFDCCEDKSKYYSLMATLASALSDCANYTNFEKQKDFVMDKNDEEVAKRRLCLLVDIVLDKVGAYNLLMEDGNLNTFSTAYYARKENGAWKPFFVAFLLFLVQVAYAAYFAVGIYLYRFEPLDLTMIPLVIVAFVASVFIIRRRGKQGIMDLYEDQFHLGQWLIKSMDTIVTILVRPFMVIGCIMTMMQSSHVEATLLSAALLFILNIDDYFMSTISTNKIDFIQDYLVKESIKNITDHCALRDQDITFAKLFQANPRIGMEFGDFILTNTKEQASMPVKAGLYQPFNVFENEIEPIKSIDKGCLIKSMQWSYNLNESSTPSIGYLKITTMRGETIDFNYFPNKNADTVTSNVKYQLAEGVYVITQFKATARGVSHLRVCGSRKANDFLEALNYYHLWSIESEAKKMLQKDISLDSTVRLGKNQKLLVKAAEKETIDDKIKRECLYVRMGNE